MKRLNLLPSDFVDEYSARKGVRARIRNVLKKEYAKTKRGAKHELLALLLRYHQEYDLRILPPDKMCELVKQVASIYPTPEKHSYKVLCKAIKRAFSFSSAVKWMKDNERIYHIYSNLRFCPYCNADTVYALRMGANFARSDLDHFFPQDKYPFLATSLYNLIPSCTRCNSPVKRNKNVDPGKMSMPYANDIDSDIHFDLKIRNLRGLFGDISPKTCDIMAFPSVWGVNGAKGLEFVRFFGLEEMYGKQFMPEVGDLMRRIRVFISSYPDFWHLKGVDLAALMWHDIPEPQDINKFRLGKLKRDILKQFVREMV